MRRTKQQRRWPVFTNVSQAASETGVPLAVLRSSKAAGCPAFRESRLYFLEWLTWFFAQREDAEDLAINWRQRINRADALTREMKLQKLRDSVLDAEHVRRTLAAWGALHFSTIKRLFLSELPPEVKGKDEHAIRARCEQFINELWATWEQHCIEVSRNEPEPNIEISSIGETSVEDADHSVGRDAHAPARRGPGRSVPRGRRALVARTTRVRGQPADEPAGDAGTGPDGQVGPG